MRMLFTFAGGAGHAEPLVPIARAGAAAGHEVAFAGRPWVVARLAGRGFAGFPDTGDPVGEPTAMTPLVPFDAAREERLLREGFAWFHARRRATVVLELCERWAPDVIVCDDVDFGAMVAAERARVPHATVLVIAAGALVRPAVVAAPLNLVRAEHGLPPDPEVRMASRHLVLSPMPPSLRDPAFPLPGTAHSIRPGSLEPVPAEIGAGVPTVFERPGYRAAAERVRNDARALPDAGHAVALLERLSAGSGAGA